MQSTLQTLEVWGDFACFAMPHLSVEHFSYPVMTPHAAREIFDAIYSAASIFGRQFYWQVERIEIMAPVHYVPILGTIELTSSRIGLATDASRLSGPELEQDQIRQIVVLKDVRYRLTAKIVPFEPFTEETSSLVKKFVSDATGGSCCKRPSFGLRDHPAQFRLVNPNEDRREPIGLDHDFGLMLYDTIELSSPRRSDALPYFSFFRARAHNGSIEVPEYSSCEVLKPRPQNVN